MNVLITLSALAAAAAAGWSLRPLPSMARAPAVESRASRSQGLRAGRPLWSALAGAAAALWFPGPVGLALAPVTAVVVWVVAGRIEPRSVREARERSRAELPSVVGLLAAALRAGLPPEGALDVVCAALPGAAADRLAGARSRLALGADPAGVWTGLAATDDALAPLGRCLARAHSSGAPVADLVGRLAADLARDRRAAAEDRARAVGVKAALPLGLCLLPAFVLVGIVPVVAGLLTELV